MYTRNEKIVPIHIEEELKDSYISYAMSVIVGRALPDVRDGLKPVHRRILYAMKDLNLEHNKPYKKCARIVGECFVKNTLILTQKGLVPVQDVCIADKVYTHNGVHSVTALYEMPSKQLLKVSLENGSYNEVTPSQKFKVLDENWDFVWKEAKDLTDKDYVVIKSYYPGIEKPVKLEHTYRGEQKYLNKNLAYLLGFFVSEGWITNDYSKLKHPRIGWGSTTKASIEKIADILMQEFDYLPTIQEKRYKIKGKSGFINNCTYSIRINRLDINEFFVRNFNLAAKNAFTKEIPRQIFVSPKQIIFSFVSGLIEGDGSVHPTRNTIHYGSVSKKLIKQLGLLLQHLGIFSTSYMQGHFKKSRLLDGHVVKSNYKFKWLEIRGSSALLLAKNIQLCDMKKQANLQRILQKRRFPFSYDIIPYGGEHIFKELSARHIGSGWYKDTDSHKFRMGIKYPTGCKIRYSSGLAAKPLRMSQIAENNIYFLKVSSVKDIPAQKTYDLQVEGAHEFVANGMLVHNCLGKYHPHGDIAVYDTLVRMAQDFSLRYPLVDGQGNFGCFTKDTKIKLTDGRTLGFRQLIKENRQGKKNYTFVFNHEKQKLEIAEIKKPRLTRKKAQIIKVVLDNGEEIKCTPDHRFMLRDGIYKQAKDLKPQDSLTPLYSKLYDGKDDANLKGYEMIYQPLQNEWGFVHHLADDWNLQNNVYKKSAGKIRHHKDFNKLNNNPDNVRRIQWGQHWQLHKAITSLRHKNDPEYVKKLADGRKRFFADPKNISKISSRMIARNQKNWQDLGYRNKMSRIIRLAWQRPEYRQRIIKASSKNLKNLWKKKEYQQFMSKLKSAELKKRWQDQDYRNFIAEITRRTSLRIWSDPKHREYISRVSKKRWESPAYRQKMSEQAKRLWKDPGYRSKYGEDHFRKMAKVLWQDPSVRELHREKAKEQWRNPDFRAKVARTMTENNRKRIKENPSLMRELSEKAAVSLRKKWQDPVYKEKVVKSRILGFVNSLLNTGEAVTPELYEQKRRSGLASIKTISKYFSDFEDMVTQAKQTLNHKVKSVEFLDQREDVYDLTIDKWHNFALAAGVIVHNSVDGDSPAAQRYTEARLASIADEMLADLEKDSVEFMPNFDESLQEPRLLPAALPNLLANGSSGIAVGMATNIPPHNLTELADAIALIIDKPEAELKEIMRIVKAPDFPTGGIICGRDGIKNAYSTGRGLLKLHAKANIESVKGGKERIVVSEIPYQVNKSNLISSIADLVQEKKLEGISDIRDESDKDGMRMVIELKRDANAQVVLNQLYKHTQMQETFGVIMLALVENRPRVLTLRQMLDLYIEHRKEIVIRRTKYDLKKAQDRAHILEGFKIAIANIDKIVALIKKAKSPDEAREQLIDKFDLSERQAQAILEMQLQRLTGLERDKIEAEYLELIKRIEYYKSLLCSEKKILQVIREEILEIKKKYGDERRTQITAEATELDIEDLIAEEDVVITISHAGYIKRLPVSAYRKQRRGGKGVTGAQTREEDFIEYLFIASTHDYMLFFTNIGRVHWLKVHEIPQAGKISKGKAIINMLELAKEERVTAFVPVKEFKEGSFLIMVTKQGLIKKTNIQAYSNPRKGGIIGIGIEGGDELIQVLLTDGKQEILIATREGKAIRFNESDVRDMGRAAKGVRGINLAKKDVVIGAQLLRKDATILTVTINGFGKRTDMDEYRIQSRGGKGVTNIKTSDRNGEAVSVLSVTDKDEIMLITEAGMIVRCSVKDLRETGRSTQGVRLMRLDAKDKVSCVAPVVAEEEAAEETKEAAK